VCITLLSELVTASFHIRVEFLCGRVGDWTVLSGDSSGRLRGWRRRRRGSRGCRSVTGTYDNRRFANDRRSLWGTRCDEHRATSWQSWGKCPLRSRDSVAARLYKLVAQRRAAPLHRFTDGGIRTVRSGARTARNVPTEVSAAVQWSERWWWWWWDVAWGWVWVRKLSFGERQRAQPGPWRRGSPWQASAPAARARPILERWPLLHKGSAVHRRMRRPRGLNPSSARLHPACSRSVCVQPHVLNLVVRELRSAHETHLDFGIISATRRSRVTKAGLLDFGLKGGPDEVRLIKQREELIDRVGGELVAKVSATGRDAGTVLQARRWPRRPRTVCAARCSRSSTKSWYENRITDHASAQIKNTVFSKD
jgi:hypothetical protein